MKKTEIIPKNIELTEELKEYIEKRMSYFEKFFDFDDEGFNYDFRVGRESASHANGAIFFAEVTMQTPGKVYGARADKQESLERAVDKLKDELKRKINDSRDKKNTLKKKGGREAKENSREV